MPSKRGNEHSQLRPEEYEAVANRETEAPSGSFQKASQEEMGKRRIFKSIRRSGGGTPSGGASRAPGTPSTGSGSVGGNAFASIKATVAPPAASGNAFANFSFAAPPAVSFPFATSSITNTSDNLASMMRVRDERLLRLKTQFFAKNKEHISQGIRSHLALDIVTYHNYCRAIRRPVQDAEKALKQKATPAAAPSKQTTSTSAAPSVSFGSTTKAAAPASGGFSFGSSPEATPAPAASFSFGGSATPGKPPVATQASFSFGGAAIAPAPKSTTTPPAPTEGSDEPSDVMGVSKPEAVEHLVDPNWREILSITRAKYLIFEKVEGSDTKVCKAYPIGPLRLEQYVSDPSNRRMVIREPTSGRVRLNLKIVPGMPSRILLKSNKKYLSIMGIRDASKGEEQFLIRACPEDFDDLVAKVNEWTQA